jgi:epoxide hydrolase-like predicted phosphatase
MAVVLGLREDRATGLIDRMFGGMKADITMFDALRAAKSAGIRTGLLSNSWGVDRYDRSHFPQLFDATVISGEEGMRKPDRAIYELALERMELPAAQIVFVDDLPGNLKPAAALGMRTIHHTSGPETVTRLEKLFARPLR